MTQDERDLAREEAQDFADRPEPEGYHEEGLSCSRCGSFCVELRDERYFSGNWSAGCPEMLTATIATCSCCGLADEI